MPGKRRSEDQQLLVRDAFPRPTEGGAPFMTRVAGTGTHVSLRGRNLSRQSSSRARHLMVGCMGSYLIFRQGRGGCRLDHNTTTVCVTWELPDDHVRTLRIELTTAHPASMWWVGSVVFCRDHHLPWP